MNLGIIKIIGVIKINYLSDLKKIFKVKNPTLLHTSRIFNLKYLITHPKLTKFIINLYNIS